MKNFQNDNWNFQNDNWIRMRGRWVNFFFFLLYLQNCLWLVHYMEHKQYTLSRSQFLRVTSLGISHVSTGSQDPSAQDLTRLQSRCQPDCVLIWTPGWGRICFQADSGYWLHSTEGPERCQLAVTLRSQSSLPCWTST